MSRCILAVLTCIALSDFAAAADVKPAQFWNLTGETVTHLYLAPAGSGKWSTDQCRNDPDGAVDFDERLRVTGATSGRYDVKLTQKSGRTCMVHDVEIKSGRVFSIGKDELAHCGG
jgi:hypothetical protein